MPRPRKKNNDNPTDIYQIAYRYRAYPTDLQEYKLENWLFILQSLYNSAIEQRRTAYKTEGKSITYTDQQNALPIIKTIDPALKIVYSQVLQECLQRVDKAYEKFFWSIKQRKAGQKVKVSYPKMKKLSKYSSFTFPQVWIKDTEIVQLHCEADSRFATLVLPGIGALKIRLHRPLDWEKAKTVTIKRMPSGDWYVSIAVEQVLQPKLTDNGKTTGIDVGLIELITTSDESYRKHPKFLYKSEEKLKKKQRSLSRKKKKSLNYAKQRIRLAKQHERIANQRKDFLHKLSLWLVLNYSFIAFEKLNIPGMVRNPRLAKAILDAGWGNLIRYTTYKSVMLRGNDVVRVNPAFSSQECSICGYRVPKTLAERLHICPNCGVVMCRELNASRVIKSRAFRSNTVGAGTAPNRQVLPANAYGDGTSTLSSCSGQVLSLKRKPRLKA